MMHHGLHPWLRPAHLALVSGHHQTSAPMVRLTGWHDGLSQPRTLFASQGSVVGRIPDAICHNHSRIAICSAQRNALCSGGDLN